MNKQIKVLYAVTPQTGPIATSMTSEESLQNDETKTEGKWSWINHFYDLKENAYFLIFNLEKVTLIRCSKWDFSFLRMIPSASSHSSLGSRLLVQFIE